MLVAHRALALVANRLAQSIHVVLHVLQHFAHAVAFDDLVDPPIAVVIETDVRDVRVTEEIVKVAERLLVRADEERAEEVLVAVLNVVQLHPLLHVVIIDEAVDLAVRVAGHVGNRRLARWALVETMDRHDREQLVDRPDIWQRLEDRQVAEERVGGVRLEILEFFGHARHVLRLVAHLRTRRPEHPLGKRAVLKTHVADREEVHCLIARLQRVVVTLEQTTLRHRVVRLEEVDDRTRHFTVLVLRNTLQRRRHSESVEAIRAEHVEDEHALLRDHRATRFGHDRRMRDTFFVADRHDLVDDVGRVFLQRVVRRELEVRLAAVVINTEATTNVEIAHACAHLREFRVDAREFVHASRDLTNVVNLRTHVAVQELEAILHAARTQVFEHVDHFSEREAELRLHARRVTPAPSARRREIHAHADLRTDLILLGVLHDEAKFCEVLDDRNDRATELRRKRDELDVAVFLEAVANDEALGRIAREAHDREQFRLRADLKTEPVLRTAFADVVHHATLLVHLDRVDGVVLTLVAVLLDRHIKRVVEIAQTTMQEIGEVQEDGRSQTALAKTLHDVEKVDLAAGRARWAHKYLTRLRDFEEALAPTTQVVKISRIIDRPRINAGLHARRRSDTRRSSVRIRERVGRRGRCGRCSHWSGRRKNLRHRSLVRPFAGLASQARSMEGDSHR